MVHSKTRKIELLDYGQFLVMEQGCIIVKDEHKRPSERYPLLDKEIGEVTLKVGNWVSVEALASLVSWNIDTTIISKFERPIAIVKSVDSYSHVKTRISQYEALKNGKGIYIAEQIVKSKIIGQNMVLNRYHIKTYELETTIKLGDLRDVRKNFIGVEGKHAIYYYNNIFKLFPEKIRPKDRRTYKAYEGTNNIFNLAYEMLKSKVYRAIINAKLEPYLGFLHSIQFGKPSLVCDFQELYRYLIDDFLIRYCQKLNKKDFIMVKEVISDKKTGKRIFLNHSKTDGLVETLDLLFYKMVEIPRMKVGKKQSIETLINEEALLLAKYLRGERKTWITRIPAL